MTSQFNLNLIKIVFIRGAVALDGRIEPGDMILQVNDVNFENMSNDEAVRVLREVVQKPGFVSLKKNKHFFMTQFFLVPLNWLSRNVGIQIQKVTLRYQELNRYDQLIQVRKFF